MKRLFIILVICLPVLGFAQESELNNIFKKYSGQQGYTSIHITSYMFELFSKLETESDDDIQSLTKGMEAIKILTASGTTAQKEAFYNDVVKALEKSSYKDFMIINDEGQEIKFMVHEEGDKISEFVMVVNDSAEPVLLFLQGDIDLANISKMSKSMNVKGFEHLEKVEDKTN